MNSPGIRRWVRAWSRRQLYSFFSSLGALLSHRVGTLMTVLVLGIAMALPIGLYVSLDNLRGVDLRAEEWGSITVFLDAAETTDDAAELLRVINARPDATATGISPQQGLDEFRAASGFGEALDVLDTNPLPWVVLVRPKAMANMDIAAGLEILGEWLKSQKGVDVVQLDYKWLKRLSSLLALGNALVSVLSLLFSLAVVVVVANTIRMDVANRSDEIEILSLVGASENFIRQPFLYSGFWYGLMGSALALGLLFMSLHYLQSPLDQLLDAYGNSFRLSSLTFRQAFLVLLSGGGLGFLGAWVSVERYLWLLRRGGLLGRI